MEWLYRESHENHENHQKSRKKSKHYINKQVTLFKDKKIVKQQKCSTFVLKNSGCQFGASSSQCHGRELRKGVFARTTDTALELPGQPWELPGQLWELPGLRWELPGLPWELLGLL